MKKYKVSWCLKVKNSELQKVIDFCSDVCGYPLALAIEKEDATLRAYPDDETVFVRFNRRFIIRQRVHSPAKLYFDNFEKFVERHIERSKSQKEN